MNMFRKLICILSVTLLFNVAIKAQDSLSAFILTPKETPKPKINGPKVFGVRPAHPILFTIPASGTRPFTMEDRNLLPNGLSAGSALGSCLGHCDGANVCCPAFRKAATRHVHSL